MKKSYWGFIPFYFDFRLRYMKITWLSLTSLITDFCSVFSLSSSTHKKDLMKAYTHFKFHKLTKINEKKTRQHCVFPLFEMLCLFKAPIS